MFTGLIEEVGTVRAITRRNSYARIVVSARTIMEDLELGDSICIAGACQTVVARDPVSFVVDSLHETLAKTTFATLGVGHRVNLERALRASDRLGGHIVQGHVGGVASVAEVQEEGANVFITLSLPADLAFECVGEGSIAVDGVSLTVARIAAAEVTVNVIPETLKRTTLTTLASGDRVNIETDILARYVRRFLQQPTDGRRQPQNPSGLTADSLSAWGYQGDMR